MLEIAYLVQSKIGNENIKGVITMTERIKVMTIFGTRPEAIKMAPLVLELEKYPESIESIVTVTAQHRQMLDQVLEIFNITPDYDLNIMKDRQTLVDITTRSLEGLNNVMQEVKPDIVLVHGDTTTTFVAGLAAFYNQIAIGHVEAGLRTWNKYSPYPEEMNRQLAGVLADLHFSPTGKSAQNLLAENKKEADIYVTGNTAIDALKTTVKAGYTHEVLDRLGEDRLVLMTAHRRENQGEPMRNMFRAIKRLVEKYTDIQVVYPVHMNPVVREIANDILGDDNRIHLIEPLDVIDFHNFASRAHLILTDSGGVQEEAPSLGVPVLVLRDTTERPEGIEAGTLKLAGVEEETIFALADELLSDAAAHEVMAKASNPYGDGHASKRIVEAILYHFNKRSEKPDTF
jgi:UDP-N-acetylglucosamine 2-epimerase (non-hydrolysing)